MTGVRVAEPEVPDAECERLKYKRPPSPCEQPQTMLPRKLDCGRLAVMSCLVSSLGNRWMLPAVCCSVLPAVNVVSAEEPVERFSHFFGVRPMKVVTAVEHDEFRTIQGFQLLLVGGTPLYVGVDELLRQERQHRKL